ncbi:unnamed protein product [Orchesella dallaii]|uniref:Uncharacterized protein n=1 Tax=Orchesella dallaii TaxID=48710 RepID=A0ABP1RMT0_9HEXA
METLTFNIPDCVIEIIKTIDGEENSSTYVQARDYINELIEQIKSLIDHHAHQCRENQILTGQIRLLTDDLVFLNGTVNRLQDRNEEVSKKYSSLETEFKKCEIKCENLKNEVEVLKAQKTVALVDVQKSKSTRKEASQSPQIQQQIGAITADDEEDEADPGASDNEKISVELETQPKNLAKERKSTNPGRKNVTFASETTTKSISSRVSQVKKQVPNEKRKSESKQGNPRGVSETNSCSRTRSMAPPKTSQNITDNPRRVSETNSRPRTRLSMATIPPRNTSTRSNVPTTRSGLRRQSSATGM